MERAKNVLYWGKKEYGTYFQRPLFTSTVFWIMTLLCALVFGHGVWVFFKYYSLLPFWHLRLNFAMLVLMALFPWIRARQLHKRINRLLKENAQPDTEVLREVASFSNFMLVIAYLIIIVSVQLLLYFFRGQS